MTYSRAYLLARAPAKALVARNDLIAELAGEAIRPQELIERMPELLLLFGLNQVHKLEVAANVAIGHRDAHVFEVLLQRQQSTLVAQRDEPREGLTELMARKPPGAGGTNRPREGVEPPGYGDATRRVRPPTRV